MRLHTPYFHENRQQRQRTSNPEFQNLVNQGYSAAFKCNIWNNSYKVHEASHAVFCYKTSSSYSPSSFSSSSSSSSSYSTRTKTKFMRKLRYLVLVALTAVRQCCVLICPSSTSVHFHLLTQIPNTCHFYNGSHYITKLNCMHCKTLHYLHLFILYSLLIF
jgi:hypothetical protein